uniref:Uncharacterized protein n=1 Tax=Picea glauca TaxID=3330 RepID=A0A117NJ37_PICGL|nr:hypothetical protein ABT39_MTgene789 [Picea glauca]
MKTIWTPYHNGETKAWVPICNGVLIQVNPFRWGTTARQG